MDLQQQAEVNMSSSQKREQACCRRVTVPISVFMVCSILITTVVCAGVSLSLAKQDNDHLVKDMSQREQKHMALGLAEVVQQRLVSVQDLTRDFSRKLAVGLIPVPVGDGPNGKDRLFLQAIDSYITAHTTVITSMWFRTPEPKSFVYGLFRYKGFWAAAYTYVNGTFGYIPWNSTTQHTYGQWEDGLLSIWTIVNNISVPESATWYGPGYYDYEMTTFANGMYIGTAVSELWQEAIVDIIQGTEIQGVGFLLDANANTFLASTDPAVVNEKKLPTDSSAEGKMVRYAIQMLRSGHVNAQSQDCVSVWTNSSTVVTSYTTIELAGLNWVVGIADKPQMTGVDYITFLGILGCAIALMIVSGLFGLCSTWPLYSVSRAMRAAAKMNFTEFEAPPRSIIAEVRTIQDSFELLRAGAVALSKIVPPDAMKELMSGGAVVVDEAETGPMPGSEVLGAGAYGSVGLGNLSVGMSTSEYTVTEPISPGASLATMSLGMN